MCRNGDGVIGLPLLVVTEIVDVNCSVDSASGDAEIVVGCFLALRLRCGKGVLCAVTAVGKVDVCFDLVLVAFPWGCGD